MIMTFTVCQLGRFGLCDRRELRRRTGRSTAAAIARRGDAVAETAADLCPLAGLQQSKFASKQN